MTTILADITSAADYRTSRNTRRLDETANGNLWAVAWDNSTSEQTFWYSTDGGESWTEDTGAALSDTSADTLSFFIDSDDYAHVAYHKSGTAQYRRGTPNAERTAWTWSSEFSITVTSTATHDCDLVAHPEGTGWKVHLAVNDSDGATGARLRYARLNITSGGTISQDTSTIVQTQEGGGFRPMIDFRHTGDGKTKHSTTDVFLVWVSVGSPGLQFAKVAFSAGPTWSVGTIRTIDSNGFTNANAMCYDPTDDLIYMAYARSGDGEVVRCYTRNLADTTTSTINPPAISDGTVSGVSFSRSQSDGRIYLFGFAGTSRDLKYVSRLSGSWDGSWTAVESGTLALHDNTVGTQRSSVRAIWTEEVGSNDKIRFFSNSVVHQLSGTFQGVGTLAADILRTRELSGTLQGVGRWIKARLTKIPQGSSGSFVEPEIDFTVYDGYLEGSDGVVHSLIYHEDGEIKGATAALPTRAEKQDVGQNPNEQRPEFGDFFAQGDFSHGADQLFFHHEGRDPKRFLASEGYDITEEGNLSHLHDVAEALDTTNVGAITQANGVILVADGQDVRVGNGAFPGTWGTENPEAGGTPSTVEDLTSRGDEVFAALGAEGVHIRSSAGTWSHFQPDAATDLDVGTATRVAWLKDRLMVVGQAGRDIYEVVADSTPTSIKTLPEGWTFESIFEAGAFLYAPAVNADAGLSRVHILGLNDGGTAIEDKGSIQVPRGELLYSGIGYVGQIFLGGGRANDDGGYDPVLYQAIQAETGFLQLLRITSGVGGNNDCSVLAFEALGDSIVFSWSQDASALTGERAGIAMYHLGRQAFSQHLKKDAVSSAQVTDILFYEGRLVFSIDADGLYYEDTASFVADAYLISSIADWGGASLKIWDRVEVAHHSLGADTSVTVEYTTEDPVLEEWFTTIVSDTDGETGKSSRLSNITSRYFAVRISSTANAGGTAAPTIHSFSVRSNLTRSQPEFTLTRFVRILAKDRKDGKGSVVYKDPINERFALMLLLDSWVTVWEPGIIWQAFVKSISDTEPAEPFLSQTNGEPLKEAYLVRLDLIATGEAA